METDLKHIYVYRVQIQMNSGDIPFRYKNALTKYKKPSTANSSRRKEDATLF